MKLPFILVKIIWTDQILKTLFQKEKDRYHQDAKAAAEVLAVGAYEVDPSLDKITLASMTAVASTLLNHDEAYMKR